MHAMNALVLSVIVVALALAWGVGAWRLSRRAAAAASALDRARDLRRASADAIAALHHARALPVVDAPDPALDRLVGAMDDAPAPPADAAERRVDGRRRTRATRPIPAPPAPRLRRDP